MSKEREKRIIPIQLRAANKEESDSRTISGYAALFNSPSEEMWGFVEYIEPGAFREALKKSDVRALKNHDPNLILARTGAGLELREDDKGLYFEFEAPDTTVGDDLLKDIRAGRITQSSFQFTIKKQRWEEEKKGEDEYTYKRFIEEVDELYDIAPVTFPAYPETTVHARSKVQEMRVPHHEIRQREIDILKI